MSGYEGVGERLRERMLALGYTRDDGELDIQRFCWDHRFSTTLVRLWLKDEGTPFKELVRLCDILGVSERWLLTGTDRGKAQPRQGRGARKLLLVLSLAAAGLLWPERVPAQPGTPRLDDELDPVHLIGSKRRGKYFRLGTLVA